MPDEIRKLLATGADELGIILTEEQVGACMSYLAELRKWNRKINLTAIRDDHDVVIKHFLDSFSFFKGIEVRPGLALADIGSGAGFPALPIKIAAPQVMVTMIESAGKKASFLRHIVRMLQLSGADIIDMRTEEVPEQLLGSFNVVTARAFADMEKALREGARLLRPGGVLVLSRGPEEHIETGKIEKAGLFLQSRTALALPFSRDPRAIWIFRRAE